MGVVSATQWLEYFWQAMTHHVGSRPEHTDDVALDMDAPPQAWETVLEMFGDVALFPGANGVLYPLGARVPLNVYTPIVWLDRVKFPLDGLLQKMGACQPHAGLALPPAVLDLCVNPANGMGCLRVVSWYGCVVDGCHGYAVAGRDAQ